MMDSQRAALSASTGFRHRAHECMRGKHLCFSLCFQRKGPTEGEAKKRDHSCFKNKRQTGPSDNKGINKKVSTKPSDNNKDKTTTGTTPKKISKSLPDSYRVTRTKDESAAKSLQQKAMSFIQSCLYRPGTKRTTKLLSLKKKRGASQGAAAEFANKKLGASQKARIARSNKRFIRQQKLIPL